MVSWKSQQNLDKSKSPETVDDGVPVADAVLVDDFGTDQSEIEAPELEPSTPSQEVIEPASQPSKSIASGSWTPTLTSFQQKITVLVKSARFTQVENLVTAFFDISITQAPSVNDLGPLFLDGLPLVSIGDPGCVGGAVIYYHSHFKSNIHQISGTVAGNTQRLQLWRSIGAGSPLNHLVASDLQNISNLSGSIQYTCYFDI